MRFAFSELSALSSGEPRRSFALACFALSSPASCWIGAGESCEDLLCSSENGALAIRTLIHGLEIRMAEFVFILGKSRHLEKMWWRASIKVKSMFT